MGLFRFNKRSVGRVSIKQASAKPTQALSPSKPSSGSLRSIKRKMLGSGGGGWSPPKAGRGKG